MAKVIHATVAEYARRFDVHPDSVRRAIRAGRIEGIYPLGNRKTVRIPIIEVERRIPRRPKITTEGDEG